jgi:hypothetical protein
MLDVDRGGCLGGLLVCFIPLVLVLGYAILLILTNGLT